MHGDYRPELRRRVLLVSVALLLSAPAAFAQLRGTIMEGGRVLTINGPLPEVDLTYSIQVGDVLEIGFFRTPELNRERTVGPDGDIHLPLIGTVHAAGLGVEELTDLLTERYAEELRDPEIVVNVKAFSGLSVFISGEVNNPGEVTYRGRLTATQAIFSAGGFKQRARLDSVLLIRKTSDGASVGTILDVREVLRRAEFEKDPLLAPSDMLFVPRSRIATVNDAVQEFLRNNIPIPLSLTFFVGN